MLPLPRTVWLILLHVLALRPSSRDPDALATVAGKLAPRLSDSNFTCPSLSLMLMKKDSLLRSLDLRIEEIRSQQAITPEQKLKMEILLLYRRELKSADKSFLAVLRDLNATLSSDSKSLENIKRSCELRLDDMRTAAVSVEMHYNSLLELEREMHALHPNSSLQVHHRIMDEMLAEISQAADNLEDELEEDVFRDSKNIRGAVLETVVKLREGDLYNHGWLHMQKRLQESQAVTPGAADRQAGISMLIDSMSNQYILSRPHDLTLPTEDHHFVHDIINVLLLASVLGIICSFVRIPPLFGYIFSGLLLGPVGYNVIGAVVQMETIGEFGVIFIVFVVGLEYSPEKLRKVWRVSVYGGNLLLLASILLAVLLGSMLGVHPQHSLFVAASLSLSSNALALKFVNINSPAVRRHASEVDLQSQLEESDPDSTPARVAGILVMQDIQLGMLMAIMPLFVETTPTSSQSLVLSGLLPVGQLVVCLLVLFFLARGFGHQATERVSRMLSVLLNRSDSCLLGSVSLCFILILVAERVGASLELGCFVAGLVISTQCHSAVDQVRRLMVPVRDIFSIFFFASVGFRVFPTFLQSEFSMIFVVTFIVLFLKFFLALFLLGFFVGHCRWEAWLTAVSLAPVSEFSFVLASRARRLSIISREAYLVVLSIAALTLLLSPLVWQALLLLRGLRHSPPHHSLLRLSRMASAYFRPKRTLSSGHE